MATVGERRSSHGQGGANSTVGSDMAIGRDPRQPEGQAEGEQKTASWIQLKVANAETRVSPKAKRGAVLVVASHATVWKTKPRVRSTEKKCENCAEKYEAFKMMRKMQPLHET